MTYRDLPIHQRINAKGNKVHYSPRIETQLGWLLKRIVNSKADMWVYEPTLPIYSIQVKHNNYDLPYNYNPHA